MLWVAEALSGMICLMASSRIAHRVEMGWEHCCPDAIEMLQSVGYCCHGEVAAACCGGDPFFSLLGCALVLSALQI